MIIGIDPDVEFSGVACYNKIKNELYVQKLSFFKLLEFLQTNKEFISVVKIEAGWLVNKSNFHSQQGFKQRERIAKNVGENHEVGKKIVEMCQYLNINFKLQKPLKKIWKGAGNKITHKELELQLNKLKIHFQKTSNQDIRDAVLICLY